MSRSPEQPAKPEQGCLDFLTAYLKAHNAEPGLFSGGQDISPDVLRTAVYPGVLVQESSSQDNHCSGHAFSRSSQVHTVIPEPYACVRNLQAVLPEGERFEFDLLVCAGKRIVWVECKTGKYSGYLAKYSRIAELLGLKRENVILAAPEANADDSESITCCTLEDFPEIFRKACT